MVFWDRDWLRFSLSLSVKRQEISKILRLRDKTSSGTSFVSREERLSSLVSSHASLSSWVCLLLDTKRNVTRHTHFCTDRLSCFISEVTDNESRSSNKENIPLPHDSFLCILESVSSSSESVVIVTIPLFSLESCCCLVCVFIFGCHDCNLPVKLSC
jgi:hypothetical protein